MAAKRIRYDRTKKPENFSPPAVYGNFIRDLLAGDLTATRLIESRNPAGHLTLEYDDPTGNGPRGQGNGRDKG
jgi:hypothetical protein